MRRIILFTCILVFCTMGLLSLLSMKSSLGANNLAAKNLLEFKTELAHFKEQLGWVETKKSNLTQLKDSYRNLRDKFKTIEFLIEFLDPAFHKDYLNGPPLPHLDKTSPSLLVIEPHGLQVIDELMAEPLNTSSITQLKNEVALLQEQIINYQFQSNLTNRMIYESIFTGLIRLYTLGLTGFDTPGTLCAIDDSRAALKSMREFFVLLEANTLLIDGSLHYLNQQVSFEKFDRLYFLITYLNPMIKDLQEHKSKLGIESMEEVNPGKHALNFRSKNLFDPKLLYPEFYVKLPAKFNHSKAVKLGELLFFDPILSSNNKRSCASCHNPKLAFTDGLEKSKGLSPNVFVSRNSPSLINAVYSERFFWDLRAESLEDQTEHVIFSKEEFNTDYLTIFGKLARSNQYQQLFKEVFPEFKEGSVNKTTLSFALSAYVLSLTSFNTPFDRFIRGESNELADDAKKGYNLFMGKAACGTCHFAPLFSGTVPPQFMESESEVLGIPRNPREKKWVLDNDPGRAEGRIKEKVDFYVGSIKTPGLRNLNLTKPYMHNGAFNTLEEVIDFYNKGGGVGNGLTVPHQTLSDAHLNLSKSEQKQMIAFLLSLNEDSISFKAPMQLPEIEGNENSWNRKPGGDY